MKQLLFASIFLLSAFCLFQACTPSSSKKTSNANEIFFADPTIYSENGVYYLTGTRNKEPLGFTMLESKDLKTWTLSSVAPEKMILKKGSNVYGEHGFWAPQILNENGQYLLTYTANEQVVIASSNQLNGLYTQDVIEPIDSSEKNIDSYIFKDDDGKYYLYHVRFNDGNYLWVADFDMATGKINKESLVQCFGATQPWETSPVYQSAPIMEGPTVIKMDGKYYMFYSANHFQSIDYGVGYAVADSPYGPWEKSSNNPIIHRSIVGENGSGHGDLFFDKENKPYYVYHVHNSDSVVAPRRTRIVPLTFKKNTDTGLYDISADGDAVIIPHVKD
ncbi:MAG: beta-xylosidase [Bacteroidales bacterium 36-12]|nr:MAG: beta-xylosidase [Bacteroidales bacterium 36-12]